MAHQIMQFTAAAIFLLVGGCGSNEAPKNGSAGANAAVASNQGEAAASPAPAAEGEEFQVVGDQGAIHRLIEWRELPDGTREAITMRDGPDRGSFARRRVRFIRREIDCAQLEFRTVGEGATVAEARGTSSVPESMGPPVRDSGSRVVVELVCSKPSRSGQTG